MGLERQDWMLAWVNLVHAGTYLTGCLDRHFQHELGISLPEQDLLSQLEKAGGTIMLSELARRIYLSKGGVTRMVDRLETAGLIQRERSSRDRRVASARLTRKGRGLLQRSRRTLVSWVEDNFRAHLTNDEVVELREALRSLLEAHGRYEGQLKHLRGEPHDS